MTAVPSSRARMRAWRVHENGPAWEVLTLEDVDQPTPGPGELAVRVDAAGVNFPDLLLCLGQYQERPPLPFTPGVEVAGTVTAAGEGARHEPGDRVVGAPALPAGGYAETCLMADDQALDLPDDVEATTGAALYLTYQTAYVGLHRRARLHAGETVLVQAGASGTGTAAVQLARAAEAHVITTASTEQKVQLCKDQGAELALNSTTDDVVAEIKKVTGGRGVDVVWDPVGGEAFEQARKVVGFEGRVVVVGFASGRIPEVPANHLLVKNYSLVGLHWGLYRARNPQVVTDAHEHLVALLREGRIRPVIDDVLTLSDVPQALRRLAGRQVRGKLVLRA